MKSSLLLRSFVALGLFAGVAISYAHDGHGMPAELAVSTEPAPQLFLDGPVPELLPQGLMVVQPSVENFRISNITGEGALQVSPRIGHFHVELDTGLGSWAIYDDSPIGINHLSPGPHQLKVSLADPTHRELLSKTIKFVIPPR